MWISALTLVLALVAAASVGFVIATLRCRRGWRFAAPEYLGAAPEPAATATEPAASAPARGDTFRSDDLQLFRRYLDAIADGIIIADPQGRLTYWNPAALRLHGYQSMTEVQSPLTDFRQTFILRYPNGELVPFEHWPIVRLLRGEEVMGYELEVTRTDTNQTWTIAYSGSVVPADGGRDPQIVLTLQELSGLRRAERELRQSHVHLSQLIESLPQLVWTCRGDDGACDFVSPQFAAYTGVPAEKFLGFGWLDLAHPDDREGILELWRQMAAKAQPLDSEFRIRHASGAYRWFKTRAVPLRDADGRVVKWFGTNTDVHDVKMAAESTARLAAIIEHNNDAIVGQSPQGIITSWNRAAERIYGHAAEEAIGHDVSLLIPPDLREEEAQMVRRIIAGGTIESFETTRLTKSGNRIAVSLTISPVLDKDGKVIGVSRISRDITGQKRDAQALRESEKRFRDLAAAVPQIVWTTDAEGKVLYRNERWEQYTGLPSIGLVQIEKVVNPEDVPKIREAWAEAMKTGVGFELEFRMRPATGGEYRWFLARAAPRRDASGAIAEWFGTSTDIDDLKRAEALAHDNEARLRGVLDSAVDGIITIDEQGTVESVNPAVVQTFGYTPEEMVGQNVKMLMPDPYGSEHDQYLHNYRSTGQRKIIGIGREVMGRRKDGSTFPIELSVSEVHLGVRRIFTGIVRDITSRKAAEQALQNSEKYLRAALDSLLVYVAVLSLDGTIVGMNRAARKAVAARGIPVEEIEGRPVAGLLLRSASPHVRNLLQQSLAKAARGEAVYLNAVCVSEGPARVVLDLMLAPMHEAQDRLGHLILSAVDVTGRELAAQQARDRQAELAHLERVRTMGHMAAGLAHELNQPLGAVANYAGACKRLLGVDRLTPERLSQALNDIESEALRAGAIIKRMRGFVKKQAPHAVAIDPNDLVQNSYRLMSFNLRQLQIETHLHLADHLPQVLADAIQIEQVLVNLIRNAVDAMENVPADRRQLEIETGLDPAGRVQIRVHDRGHGVAPGDVDRVFDSFFTTKPSGLGVGLALCRTIIQDHGGQLKAEPRAGGGMTFAFTLRNVEERLAEPRAVSVGD